MSHNHYFFKTRRHVFTPHPRFRMNGSYPYGGLHPNQPLHPNQVIHPNQMNHPNQPLHANQPVHPNHPIPMPAPGAPFPANAVPPYPPYAMQQPLIEGHNYNVPPMNTNMPHDMEHVNNGHHPINYSPHPIILNQEILIPGSDNRFYSRYGAHVPDERHGAMSFRPYVPPPNNVHMYPAQEPQQPMDDIYTSIPPELHPEYRPNANATYGPRPDAVWAPNPGEIFNFGDMLAALPQPPPLAAEQVFSPGLSPVIMPIVRSHRSSPEEGAGPRAVGGPLSGSGASEIPIVSANGPPSTTAVPSSLAVGADRLARERLTINERLAAAAHAYTVVTGSDDQELEAGLQALERRIDTEFKNAD